MILRIISNLLSMSFVIALLTVSSFVHAERDEIRLFIPAFKGPGNLGVNVATILNLQIWRTLRMEPDKNPQGEDFGLGMIVWGESPLLEDSHIAAEKVATLDNINSQFSFWGETFRYGNGVIGQTYLSIPVFSDHQRDGIALDDYRNKYNEIWTHSIKVKNKKIQLKVDIPNRRYEFSPIYLSKSIVDKFSLPSKLIMYKDPDRSSPIVGEVGNKYIGIEPRGHYQKVYSDGKRGWVYLPQLAKERNEVVDFIGGLIRIYRADWHGAKDLMKRVIETPSTATTLKVDALLYKGRCLEETGASGEKAFELAFKLNSYNHNTVRYWMMSQLTVLFQLNKAKIYDQEFDNKLTKAKMLLKNSRFLFREDDPWLNDVDFILKNLTKN